MKRLFFKTLGGLLLSISFVMGSYAQDVKKDVKEENTVKIMVLKDGKTVIDSTFSFDGDFDKEQINKLVEKYGGEEVKVEVVSTSAKTVKGKKLDPDEKEMKVKVYIDKEDSEEGDHVINIRKVMGNEGKEAKVIIMKKGDGEEEVFTILADDADLHKKGGKVIKGHENLVWIDADGKSEYHVKKIGDEEVNFFFHENDKEDVVEGHAVKMIKKGEEGDPANIMFFDTEGGDNIISGDLAFFSHAAPKAKKAIALEHLEGGLFELEINTDDLDPVIIEVFNSTGKRLYKKKVKNYYGRFLQQIELEDNESAFFTVKVTQGDKEIIGEYEFK
jgi:hypothetical protein